MLRMSEVELSKSLITTLRYLLKSKDDVELQVKTAKEMIKLSCEQSEKDNLSPISIEEDAVWLNYLRGLLSKIDNDIELVMAALSQLGVSNLDFLVSNLNNIQAYKSQGDSTLDFSSINEK